MFIPPLHIWCRCSGGTLLSLWYTQVFASPENVWCFPAPGIEKNVPPVTGALTMSFMRLIPAMPKIEEKILKSRGIGYFS